MLKKKLPALLLSFTCLLLVACSTADASYSASSGFTKSSTLSVLDSTPTGKAIEAELFASGFNIIAGSHSGPAAQAEPQYLAKLIVRRTWRGVVAGVVPGLITLTISDSKTGNVVATANYDLGSFSYNSTHDAARAIVHALSREIR